MAIGIWAGILMARSKLKRDGVCRRGIRDLIIRTDVLYLGVVELRKVCGMLEYSIEIGFKRTMNVMEVVTIGVS
jgi:hypothetical protein